LFKVFAIYRLDVAGNLKRNSRAFRDVDGEMSSFERRDPADEAQIRQFLFHKTIETEVDSVMNGSHSRHGFRPASARR
jgi:hypothetical protein